MADHSPAVPDGFDSRERASLAAAIDSCARARAAIDTATGRLRMALAAVAKSEGVAADPDRWTPC